MIPNKEKMPGRVLCLRNRLKKIGIGDPCQVRDDKLLSMRNVGRVTLRVFRYWFPYTGNHTTMRIEGVIQACDFEDDTLMIQLPKGFFSGKHHVIRAGKVIITTEGILPPRNTACDECVSGLTHESEG